MEPLKVIEAINAFKTVYEFLKEIDKLLKKREKGRWKLLRSGKKEAIESKFKEALTGTKNVLQSRIWYGKGFAIEHECGIKVDKSFHLLMALVITNFNEISMRLDPEKLDEKLVKHLINQLKMLEDRTQSFISLQSVSSYKDKEERAQKTISEFTSRLWDFCHSMEPYLKPRNTDIDMPRS